MHSVVGIEEEIQNWKEYSASLDGRTDVEMARRFYGPRRRTMTPQLFSRGVKKGKFIRQVSEVATLKVAGSEFKCQKVVDLSSQLNDQLLSAGTRCLEVSDNQTQVVKMTLGPSRRDMESEGKDPSLGGFKVLRFKPIPTELSPPLLSKLSSKEEHEERKPKVNNLLLPEKCCVRASKSRRRRIGPPKSYTNFLKKRETDAVVRNKCSHLKMNRSKAEDSPKPNVFWKTEQELLRRIAQKDDLDAHLSQKGTPSRGKRTLEEKSEADEELEEQESEDAYSDGGGRSNQGSATERAREKKDEKEKDESGGPSTPTSPGEMKPETQERAGKQTEKVRGSSLLLGKKNLRIPQSNLFPFCPLASYESIGSKKKFLNKNFFENLQKKYMVDDFKFSKETGILFGPDISEQRLQEVQTDRSQTRLEEIHLQILKNKASKIRASFFKVQNMVPKGSYFASRQSLLSLIPPSCRMEVEEATRSLKNVKERINRRLRNQDQDSRSALKQRNLVQQLEKDLASLPLFRVLSSKDRKAKKCPPTSRTKTSDPEVAEPHRMSRKVGAVDVRKRRFYSRSSPVPSLEFGEEHSKVERIPSFEKRSSTHCQRNRSGNFILSKTGEEEVPYQQRDNKLADIRPTYLKISNSERQEVHEVHTKPFREQKLKFVEGKKFLKIAEVELFSRRLAHGNCPASSRIPQEAGKTSLSKVYDLVGPRNTKRALKTSKPSVSAEQTLFWEFPCQEKEEEIYVFDLKDEESENEKEPLEVIEGRGALDERSVRVKQTPVRFLIECDEDTR